MAVSERLARSPAAAGVPDPTAVPPAPVRAPEVREEAAMVPREAAAAAVSPRLATAEARPFQTPAAVAAGAGAYRAAVTDTAAAAAPEL